MLVDKFCYYFTRIWRLSVRNNGSVPIWKAWKDCVLLQNMYLCRFPGQQGQGQGRIRSFSELPLVVAILRIKELTHLQLSLGECCPSSSYQSSFKPSMRTRACGHEASSTCFRKVSPTFSSRAGCLSSQHHPHWSVLWFWPMHWLITQP